MLKRIFMFASARDDLIIIASLLLLPHHSSPTSPNDLNNVRSYPHDSPRRLPAPCSLFRLPCPLLRSPCQLAIRIPDLCGSSQACNFHSRRRTFRLGLLPPASQAPSTLQPRLFDFYLCRRYQRWIGHTRK